MNKLAKFLIPLALVFGLAWAQTTVSYYSFTTDQGHMDELEQLIGTFELG